MELFGIVGWKNSGKTGLVERLVAAISAQGLSVSTVKHAHHAFDIDQPGKDSYRHRGAGAQEVLLASVNRWVLMHELRGAEELPLNALLARLSPVDLVLIEGYKNAPHHKVEVHRAATGQPLLAHDDSTILAVASDIAHPDFDRPVLPLDATEDIARLILKATGLSPDVQVV